MFQRSTTGRGEEVLLLHRIGAAAPRLNREQSGSFVSLIGVLDVRAASSQAFGSRRAGLVRRLKIPRLAVLAVEHLNSKSGRSVSHGTDGVAHGWIVENVE